jgi:hypothetical protein
VYFSDSAGLLYALDANLNPVQGSPYQVASSPIKSGLRIVPDSAGKAIAIFVDNNKTLLPFTGVKIWSDDPLTVLVDGQSFNIGPNTPVSTHADATGSLTIASVATDLFATPMRIWAAFMDPFERIVIYPDQEFHGRLPTMIADPNNDDPTLVNLATGKNYAGTQVFTGQQKAQAVATAVSGACQAAGIAGSAAASTGAGLPPYVTYADLPGMQYSPYNTSANRSPIPQNPYGLNWSSDSPRGGRRHQGVPLCRAPD